MLITGDCDVAVAVHCLCRRDARKLGVVPAGTFVEALEVLPLAGAQLAASGADSLWIRTIYGWVLSAAVNERSDGRGGTQQPSKPPTQLLAPLLALPPGFLSATRIHLGAVALQDVSNSLPLPTAAAAADPSGAATNHGADDAATGENGWCQVFKVVRPVSLKFSLSRHHPTLHPTASY